MERLLVIDDNPVHLDAARKQLGYKYDLTVVGSYDEGRALLGYSVNERRIRVHKQHDFDIVLTDLLMPASHAEQGSRSDGGGTEMPVGIFLALLAAKNGAKFVGLLTDIDHHSHPSSACLDAFGESEDEPDRLPIGGAQVLLCNNRNWVEEDRSVVLKEEIRTRGDGSTYTITTYQRFKRWDLLLEELLNPRPR